MAKEKDTLLKEAIADAKAVKETALANAMATLKEAFKPQLSSMLAAKLRNEEETMEEMEEQKKLDSSGIGGTSVTVDDPGPKKPSAAASSSSDIENPGQEVDQMGEGFDGMGAGDDDHELDIDMDRQGDVDVQVGDEEGGEGHEHGMEDDGLDLEAIIRELEADLGLNGGEEGMEGHGEPFGDEEHLKPEGFNKIDAGLDVNAGVTNETLEGDGEEGVSKDGKDRPSKDGVPSGKEVKPGQEVSEGHEEEVDLEEIVREIAAEERANRGSHIAAENAELKRSIREHREVIKLLRSRINEVNLLNSKLMFTTKIFRAFELSESQKKTVVGQFDRATTLREAKIIYSTLAESLSGKKNVPQRPVKNITEGASKVVGSTKPKSQTVLNEGSQQAERWQKLAGIIRS